MFDQKFDIEDIKKIQNLTGMTGLSFLEKSSTSDTGQINEHEIDRELLKDGGSTGLAVKKRQNKGKKTQIFLICHGSKNEDLSEMLQIEVRKKE